MIPKSQQSQSDMAGVEHWNAVYDQETTNDIHFNPKSSYRSAAIATVLENCLSTSKATSILEVGCGNSKWLGYLATRYGIKRVAGIDYSPIGCEQVRARLASLGIDGDIYQADLFDMKARLIGQYDFVYSLGLVEHFTCLARTVSALTQLVRPGGVLFTEMPNLRSVYGFASWAMYPSLFGKHVPYSRQDLVGAYEVSGYVNISSALVATTCFGGFRRPSERHFLRWPMVLRWPLRKSASLFELALHRAGVYRSLPGFAQYICVSGKRSS